MNANKTDIEYPARQGLGQEFHLRRKKSNTFSDRPLRIDRLRFLLKRTTLLETVALNQDVALLFPVSPWSSKEKWALTTDYAGWARIRGEGPQAVRLRPGASRGDAKAQRACTTMERLSASLRLCVRKHLREADYVQPNRSETRIRGAVRAEIFSRYGNFRT